MKTRIAHLTLLIVLVAGLLLLIILLGSGIQQAQFSIAPHETVITAMPIATPPPTPEPSATPTPVLYENSSGDVNTKPLSSMDVGNPTPDIDIMGDGNIYNGYWWYGEGWVPGLPTFEAQFLRLPPVSIGSAVFYAPGVMEANVKYRGLVYDRNKYIGAVAVPFCSEIGHDVWLKRPSTDYWEGPYLVADCSRRNDLYGHIEFRDQVVEVDFDTAVAWGLARYGGTQNDGRWSSLTGRLDCVLLSKVPPDQFDGIIVDLSVWFLQHVTFADRSENRRQVQNYLPPGTLSIELGIDNRGSSLPIWLINNQWVTFP